jgi:hypothetical protein
MATMDFDGAAAELKNLVRDDEVLKTTANKYAEKVRTCCVGNVMGSIGMERYKLEPFKHEDSSLTVKM